MRFRHVRRLASENSTAETDVHFNDRNAFLAYNISQLDTWPPTSISPQPTETFNSLDYNSLSTYSNVQVSPWIFEQVDYDISSGVPLIFSISPNAEKLLLRVPALKKDVLDMCDIIANFVSAKDLKAIGEISFFQEDESETKLFITYGILSKRYDEILKLWDEACEELMKSIPVKSLEKVALVFDQF
jgi:hypothetical protein